MKQLFVSEREHAAVIAGLRLLQYELAMGHPLPDGIQDLYENDGGIDRPLLVRAPFTAVDEFDALCERLNSHA